jgi:hypothetical protein
MPKAYGAVTKACVTVPDALMPNTRELSKNLAVSYAYAKALKPKTARKKR